MKRILLKRFLQSEPNAACRVWLIRLAVSSCAMLANPFAIAETVPPAKVLSAEPVAERAVARPRS